MMVPRYKGFKDVFTCNNAVAAVVLPYAFYWQSRGHAVGQPQQDNRHTLLSARALCAFSQRVRGLKH